MYGFGIELLRLRIEGNPFIIRFKTLNVHNIVCNFDFVSIEGNPFIIRFKTEEIK